MSNDQSRHVLLLTIGIVAGCASSASAQGKAANAVDTLRNEFPGVEVRTAEDGSVTVFGRRLDVAATRQQAAALFLRQHGDVLGVSAPQLQLQWKADLGSGKGTVFAYQQYFDFGAIPVEHGLARLLVSGQAGQYSVTFAAGHLIAERGTFAPDLIGGDAARRALQSMAEYAGLSGWSEPQRVIYAGEPDAAQRQPVRAWKISAANDRNSEPKAWTFFVNTATGRLIFARDEIYHGAAIEGHVSGMATPGVNPDTVDNPPVSTSLPDLFIRDLPGNIATTDSEGFYSLDGDGTQTTLSALLAGPFVEVRDSLTPPPFLTQPASPPGPADFLFNATPNEAFTAQVNAMIHANETHDFYKQYQPDFNLLDRAITANVNMTALSCNAFFTPVGLSVNFVASDDQCPNSAYSTVINHEYGHFIVNQLRLAQGSFGEGFADTVAIMMHDDPIVGAGLFGPGTFVRDVAGANQQYPCNNENHVCGLVLAGSWWDIKMNLQETLGDAPGLELARQLFTDWSQITTGGRLKNAAHPGTPIEVLIADDDDGDLSNGTPHLAAICDAFAAHNIPCPGEIDCNSVRMRVSCRRGTVSASIRATPNTLLTVVLDGTNQQDATTSNFGRVSVRFPSAGSGQHEICIEGCEESCRSITCN